MDRSEQLRRRLQNVPPGKIGWQQFERACIDTLTFLYVPPLSNPIIQARTLSGSERRDAVFPNRDQPSSGHWGTLRRELDARMIPFEFKNLDKTEIGLTELLQTRSYLTNPMGRLAVIVGTKKPDRSAQIKRNGIYAKEGVVILFLTTDHLIAMLGTKERGDDPADVIMDEIEAFYLQHE